MKQNACDAHDLLDFPTELYPTAVQSNLYTMIGRNAFYTILWSAPAITDDPEVLSQLANMTIQGDDSHPAVKAVFQYHAQSPDAFYKKLGLLLHLGRHNPQRISTVEATIRNGSAQVIISLLTSCQQLSTTILSS